MKNEMIILMERMELVKKGLLGEGKETKVVVDADGNESVIHLPQQIHTFEGWKQRGYQVKKGEKAIASFPIWKAVTKTVENEEGEEEETQKMIMKTSAFFSETQVISTLDYIKDLVSQKEQEGFAEDIQRIYKKHKLNNGLSGIVFEQYEGVIKDLWALKKPGSAKAAKPGKAGNSAPRAKAEKAKSRVAKAAKRENAKPAGKTAGKPAEEKHEENGRVDHGAGSQLAFAGV